MGINHISDILSLTLIKVFKNPVSPGLKVSKLLLHLLQIVRVLVFILVNEFSKSIVVAFSMVVCIKLEVKIDSTISDLSAC